MFSSLGSQALPFSNQRGCCALLGELQDVLRGKETRDGWNSNPCRTQTYSKEVNTIRRVFWYMQHVATGNLLFETFLETLSFCIFCPLRGCRNLSRTTMKLKLCVWRRTWLPGCACPLDLSTSKQFHNQHGSEFAWGIPSNPI
jgi:hypothetical protein